MPTFGEHLKVGIVDDFLKEGHKLLLVTSALHVGELADPDRVLVWVQWVVEIFQVPPHGLHLAVDDGGEDGREARHVHLVRAGLVQGNAARDGPKQP
jgi:hypothetical protein